MDEQRLRRLVDSRLEWRINELIAKIETANQFILEFKRREEANQTTLRPSLA